MLSGAPSGFDLAFPMSYLCTFEGDDDIEGSVDVNGGETVTVPDEGGIPNWIRVHGYEGTLPVLPQYYSWVNSPAYSNNQNADPVGTVTIVDDPVDEGDDPIAKVTVTNTVNYNPPPPPPPPPGSGSLEINKVVTGGPDGYVGPFDIAYSCTNGGPSKTVGVTAGTPGQLHAARSGQPGDQQGRDGRT